MSTTSIGWWGVAASAALVLLALGLSWRQHLRLEGTLVWAVGRVTLQLTLVGMALAWVLDDDRPLALGWLWVVAMVGFAAGTIHLRARHVPHAALIGAAAVSAPTAASLGVVFGLGVFPLEGEALIPVAGMMVGNALAESVLVSRIVTTALRDHRLEIEARLALGLPAAEAMRPYLREAVRTAVLPQVERTKAIGLVILPGAMTGLILAGVEPVDAVQVQLAIVLLILGVVVASVSIMTSGMARALRTADHRLVRLPGPADR